MALTINKILMASAAVIAGLCLDASVALAQEVVMRRPLPRNTIVSPNNPPVTEGEDYLDENQEPDPTAICEGGSADAFYTNVRWVDIGWSDPNQSDTCQQEFICQATISCIVDGEPLTYSADTPDSICETMAMPGGGELPPPPPLPTCDPELEICDDGGVLG